MTIPFVKTHDVVPGRVDQVSPLIRRITAANPGPFTFTGTGTYIIGRGEVAVIDPGPNLPAHLDALCSALNDDKVRAILITHTHTDHSPLSRPLQERLGGEILAFGPHGSGRAGGAVPVEEGGDMSFVPDRRLGDGDIIRGDGFELMAIHTPGHTSNHLCYALLQEHALFTGDHVMGWATSVIVPPDGNMSDYFASLEKLIARSDQVLWPTHGAPITNVPSFLDAFLAHRRMREAEILSCLVAGVTSIPAIVANLYMAVDKRLHPAAALSVLAHLEKLIAERRARLIPGNPPRFAAL